MALPGLDFADDAHRVAGSVRLGDVPGEPLVRDVGIVFEGPSWLDDVDVSASVVIRESNGELGSPDGWFEQRREVDVVGDASVVIIAGLPA
jgi:hypothetical protein